MKKNVIILTHGWTGSSVFTALIGKAGFSAGNSTMQKPDYDTFEDAELVELNRRMMEELGFTGNHEHEFNYETIKTLASKAGLIDPKPYTEFIERINRNGLWIWKDPRLTWTIRVWATFLNLEQVAFIVLTRDSEQAWITSNLRRHIQSRKFTESYNNGITSSLKQFLAEAKQPYIEFEFEDLMLKPENTVEKINEFLDIELTMEDLKSVYKAPLYKKSKGLTDKLIAAAIYFKNYSERDNRPRGQDK